MAVASSDNYPSDIYIQYIVYIQPEHSTIAIAVASPDNYPSDIYIYIVYIHLYSQHTPP